MARFLRFIFETGRTVLIALLIVVPLRLYVAQPFFVRGASMEPSFHSGDYLVIDELSYRLRDPRRGEVVVFRYPYDPSQFFIKRIIGLPGETVKSDEGRVIVEDTDTGELLQEPYISAPTPDTFRISTGPREYVVLGDNRGASSDSRRWGVLSKDLIVGRVLAPVWPPDSLSVFAAPSYQ